MIGPEAVVRFVADAGWGAVSDSQPVSGGCINDGRRLTTTRGPQLFLKVNRAAPPDMFEREAEGLRALAVAGAPRVPRPVLVGPDFLLLEYLAPAASAPEVWERFGHELARLHSQLNPRFGFAHDNYIGHTPQPNAWLEDGFEFFSVRRLLFQVRLARDHRRLDDRHVRTVERLAQRLRDIIPEQPASLLHGDLWSGNIHLGPAGLACLIDPAAYFGWAEADLAMTTLFGRLPEASFAAYAAERPLLAGWRERFPVYNLYHLLNHLNLFGSSYLTSITTVLAQFA